MGGERPAEAQAVAGASRHPSLDDRFDPAVRIVDHQLAWPALALQEMARIKDVLGPVAIRLDHIGSTAVPGLAAKPVLDLQLSVSEFDLQGRYRPLLERLGYLFVPGTDAPGLQFFAKPATRPRSHHLHVCQADGPDARRHLAVRDFLRTHPAEVARYGALKRGLVAAAPEDRIAYIAGKAPYMEDLERRALAWVESFERPRSAHDGRPRMW